jgi:hypothetical protein
MIEYELACGRIQTAISVDAIRDNMMCTEHKQLHIVKAIECREWRMHCERKTCHYTRWYASLSDATKAAQVHTDNTGHSTQTIDFMVHPKKANRVKALFGRRFKTVIVPKERSNKIEGGRREEVIKQARFPEWCCDTPKGTHSDECKERIPF